MTAKDKARDRAKDRERAQRLAAALRENLRKRKAQARDLKDSPATARTGEPDER